MSKQFSPVFIERLQKIVPLAANEKFLRPQKGKTVSFRINTLKIQSSDVFTQIPSGNVEGLSWCDELFICRNQLEESPLIKEWAEKGMIYKQSLASALVPVVLGARPGERVLDLCAAPGSKTSQIAAMMKNTGEIIAVEPIKNRFYKLKSVLQLLDVHNTTVKFVDGRRFREENLFDRILVDVPCSTEARFRLEESKSFAYWSVRKIKEMEHKQKGLLLNAFRLLKSGGTLVYSTCTFAPEENEEVIDWFLRKTDNKAIVEPLNLNAIESYPALSLWEKRQFNPQVKNCFRILPTETVEGFFITKIKKV